MSGAIDLTGVSFTPLARAPSWPEQKPVQGVRLHVQHKAESNSALRFTIGHAAQAALGALEGDRVVLSFSDAPDDTLMVLIQRGGAGRRSGSTLRRFNGSPSLTATFTASRVRLPKLTVIEPPWRAHPEGGLVIVFDGYAAAALRTFRMSAEIVANAVRERIDARLGGSAR